MRSRTTNIDGVTLKKGISWPWGDHGIPRQWGKSWTASSLEAMKERDWMMMKVELVTIYLWEQKCLSMRQKVLEEQAQEQ